MEQEKNTARSTRPTGNKARVRQYRSCHRRIDYVPSTDVWTIIDHYLRLGADPCLVGVIDYLIRSGHRAITGMGGCDGTTTWVLAAGTVSAMWKAT